MFKDGQPAKKTAYDQMRETLMTKLRESWDRADLEENRNGV